MKQNKQYNGKVTNQNQTKYPGAEVSRRACFEDYKMCHERYDKLYEKVNIAIAFCGLIFMVILSNFDSSVISKIMETKSYLEMISLIVYLVCSITSIVCIMIAVIKLLLMMKSQRIFKIDSMVLHEDEMYLKSSDEISVWLIDKYTYVVKQLKNITESKQKEYDETIKKIIIALISFAVAIMLGRGF